MIFVVSVFGFVYNVVISQKAIELQKGNGKYMLLVLVNWTYIIITAFSMGFAFTKLVENKLKYKIKEINTIIATGLVIATVYAQYFSLFCKVGLLANSIMVSVCVVIILFWKKEIGTLLYNVYKQNSIVKKIGVIVITAIWAYCTSRGYMHYDSDLYHAQSIRWIEEYGIVEGLGNIHVRFAYNSSFFAISALYSMKFLLGQSLHTVNGFIALLLSIEVLKLADIIKRKSLLMSDFARLGAFYYLTIIYRDITAPASDYAIMCVVFYIIIKWLKALEIDKDNVVPFALLCVGGVYAVSLKLTAGLILLLLIKPAYMLIKEKQIKAIFMYIFMGIIVIFPWIARTVIISGYLLYPFPDIDIFNVDWKIPAELAALDAAEIKTWGRGLNNAALVDMPVSQWFAGWFNTMLPTIGKIFILADFMCIAIFIVLVIVSIVNRKKDKADKSVCWEYILVLLSVLVSYLFWQLQAPLLRYGYVYVLLTIVITIGIIKTMLSESINSIKLLKLSNMMVIICIIILAAAKTASLAGYMYSVSDKPHYVKQQDYGIYPLENYEVDGVTFYYPKSGDRAGYEYFPAVPRKTEIIFRGVDITEGFKPVVK